MCVLTNKRPGLTWAAHAGEGVQAVHAGGALVAGARGALVHLVLAQAAREPRGADAGERANAIDTLSIVFTAVILAIVNILLTELTLREINCEEPNIKEFHLETHLRIRTNMEKQRYHQ